MNVHGFEVSDYAIRQLVARMQSAPFQCMELSAFAEVLGIPRDIKNSRAFGDTACAARVADRLIQRHRKRGDIVRDGRGWRWRSA
jgi:hypothetical protein